ncbi:hypothetical protein MASR1M48_17060 [Lactococcus petauri]
MWFCKDEFNGNWEEFDTQKEALKHAEECIGDGSDGWPEEVLDGAIKVGVVLFQSAKTNERDTENPSWDFECDVEMAEVENNLSAKINELQSVIDSECDEKVFDFSQYCQSLHYGYGQEIKELKRLLDLAKEDVETLERILPSKESRKWIEDYDTLTAPQGESKSV